MNTLLITGGTGYLGERLLPIAAQHARVVATARQPRAISRLYNPCAMDLCDKDSVFEQVNAAQPTAIIHAAAINPGVDDAMLEPVNHIGTGYLAEAANRIGCRLVLVSTDMVHDGKQAPYADDAAPTPVNDYGRSKANGEQAALNANPNSIAVRTSLIYGLDSVDRGTLGFANRLADGHNLTLFSDVMRQPVWRDALATSLVQLALTHTCETGVINIAGNQLLDRATFGEKMLDFWHVPVPDGAIEHIQAAGREDLAGVPLDVEMSLARATALGLPTPGVNEVLEQHKKGL